MFVALNLQRGMTALEAFSVYEAQGANLVHHCINP